MAEEDEKKPPEKKEEEPPKKEEVENVGEVSEGTPAPEEFDPKKSYEKVTAQLAKFEERMSTVEKFLDSLGDEETGKKETQNAEGEKPPEKKEEKKEEEKKETEMAKLSKHVETLTEGMKEMKLKLSKFENTGTKTTVQSSKAKISDEWGADAAGALLKEKDLI